MIISWLLPLRENTLPRLKAAGLSAIQLRLGSDFPLSVDDPELNELRAAADLFAANGITVEALGFYRNFLHPDPAIRTVESQRLRNVMKSAKLFGTNVIGVFAGRQPELTIEENIPLFREVWTPIAAHAEDLGIRIAFENCSMFKGYPVRGINMSHTPHAYELMFDAVPSPALGIEFDPSHCIKQHIDPIAFMKQFPGRIYHVHAKDHEVLPEQLQRHGCYDPRSSQDRLPGLGVIDWKTLFGVLARDGYRSGIAIEGEFDPAVPPGDEALCSAMQKSVQHLHAAAEGLG